MLDSQVGTIDIFYNLVYFVHGTWLRIHNGNYLVHFLRFSVCVEILSINKGKQ